MVGLMDLSDEQFATMSDGLIQDLFGCKDEILGCHRYLRECNSRCISPASESMMGWWTGNSSLDT